MLHFALLSEGKTCVSRDIHYYCHSSISLPVLELYGLGADLVRGATTFADHHPLHKGPTAFSPHPFLSNSGRTVPPWHKCNCKWAKQKSICISRFTALLSFSAELIASSSENSRFSIFIPAFLDSGRLLETEKGHLSLWGRLEVLLLIRCNV